MSADEIIEDVFWGDNNDPSSESDDNETVTDESITSDTFSEWARDSEDNLIEYTPTSIKFSTDPTPAHLKDFGVNRANEIFNYETKGHVSKDVPIEFLLPIAIPPNQLPVDLDVALDHLSKKDEEVDEAPVSAKGEKGKAKSKSKTNDAKGKKKEVGKKGGKLAGNEKTDKGKGKAEQPENKPKKAMYDPEGVGKWINLPEIKKKSKKRSNEINTTNYMQAIVDRCEEIFDSVPGSYRKYSGHFATLPVKSHVTGFKRKPDIVVVKEFVDVLDGDRKGIRLDWPFIEAYVELRNLQKDITTDTYINTVGDELNNRYFGIVEAQEGRRFVYSMGLVGTTCRFTIHNRCGVIYSSAFNINENPKAFLHILLGFAFLPDTYLGYDPYIKYEKTLQPPATEPPTTSINVPVVVPVMSSGGNSNAVAGPSRRVDGNSESESESESSESNDGRMQLRQDPKQTQKFLFEEFKKKAVPKKRVFPNNEEEKFRSIQFSAADRLPGTIRALYMEKTGRYELTDTIHRSLMIQGMATQVWRAVKDGHVYAIKDCWILASRTPTETDVLLKAYELGVTEGIPKIVDWENVHINGYLDSTDNNHGSILKRPNRIHTRTVYEGAYLPVFCFSCLRELICVSINYLETLKALVFIGIWHRDISLYNLMLLDVGEKIKKGVIIDFGYALFKDKELNKKSTTLPMHDSTLKSAVEDDSVNIQLSGIIPPRSKDEQKIRRKNKRFLSLYVFARGQRTGKHPFAPAEILTDPATPYQDDFDIQSIYFVLIYICCAYEGANNARIQRKLPGLLHEWNHPEAAPHLAGSSKTGWLSYNEKIFLSWAEKHFTTYMKPLIPLMCEFHMLIGNSKREGTILSHDACLAVFKRFLDAFNDPDLANPTNIVAPGPGSVPSTAADFEVGTGGNVVNEPDAVEPDNSVPQNPSSSTVIDDDMARLSLNDASPLITSQSVSASTPGGNSSPNRQPPQRHGSSNIDPDRSYADIVKTPRKNAENYQKSIQVGAKKGASSLPSESQTTAVNPPSGSNTLAARFQRNVQSSKTGAKSAKTVEPPKTVPSSVGGSRGGVKSVQTIVPKPPWR